MDFKVWSVMQEQVYQHRINDVDELREHIVSARDELDYSVWLTRQSGSGELNFTLASRQKAATLNTACLNEL